jgi:hypothetical protein
MGNVLSGHRLTELVHHPGVFEQLLRQNTFCQRTSRLGGEHSHLALPTAFKVMVSSTSAAANRLPNNSTFALRYFSS